jgi:8-oxo-dGTP pyrophosphatase MutT (NUDIX family)
MIVPIWLIYICNLLMQGGWENDETVEEAAAREAIEEAGVRGDLVVRYCFYVYLIQH